MPIMMDTSELGRIAAKWTGFPEEIAERGVNVCLTGLFFLVINWGMRITLASPLLRFLRKDPASIDPTKRRALLHGSCTKLTSDIHNVVAVPVGLYLLFNAPELRADPFYATNDLSYRLVVWSAGYFLHDLVNVVAFYDLEGFGFLVHGFFCCTLFLYGVFTADCQYFAGAFITWEMSSPFVHLRWYLHEMGLKESKLYLYNGMLMVLAFFLSRNCLGLYMSYVFWSTSVEHIANPKPGGVAVSAIYFFRAANICLNLLNAYWLHKMSSKAIQFLLGSTEKELSKKE